MATHIVNGVKVQTSHVYPPIPVRTVDWSAVTDEYEPGHPQGWGRTEQEAIADLLDQLLADYLDAIQPAPGTTR